MEMEDRLGQLALYKCTIPLSPNKLSSYFIIIYLFKESTRN